MQRNDLEGILSDIDSDLAACYKPAVKVASADEVSLLAEKLAAAADSWTPEVQAVDSPVPVIDKLAEASVLRRTLEIIHPDVFEPMISFVKAASGQGHAPGDAIRFFLRQRLGL